MKEVYALAEDLRLMVLLDPKTLPRMSPPKPLLKDCQDILVRHAASQSWAAELAKPRSTCKACFSEERTPLEAGLGSVRYVGFGSLADILHAN